MRAANDEVDFVFIIGGKYENRRGSYTVLAVKRGKLAVRYEDGTIAALDIEMQNRIVNNIRRERSSQAYLVRTDREKKTTPTSTTVDWNRYDLWNSAIFSRFFGEGVSGRLVYIDIDDEDFSEMAPDHQTDTTPLEDFIHVLTKTFDLRRGHLIDRQFERLSLWKSTGSPAPPPFIAALAFFCLAAQKMRGDKRFSASNYYDRLAQVLFGVKYSDFQKDVLQSGFQRASLLWEELEVWLRGKNGLCGLPSALPMYGLSHVGYPISQALLRSNDREKLAEFFLEEGFNPGQEVPPGDMGRLMAPWVPKSSLSQAAKTSWKNASARRRMAEFASLALGTWDGGHPEAEQAERTTYSTPLAIEASLIRGPKPRLLWGIVFRLPPKTSVATFEVDQDGKGLPGDGKYIQSVTVGQGLGGRWSESVAGVSIADFLVTSVDMTARDTRTRSIWQPRKVIVLTWDDELKVFRSQRHLEFGRRSMVLVYETVAHKVSGILAMSDAGGMRRVPNSLGVPKDWVLFQDIQLMRIPDTGEDPDLYVLVPEIWSSVEWEGGIALPGRKQWLPSRMPTVRINSIEEVHRLLAKIHRKSTPDHTGETSDIPALEAVGNALDINLAALNLIDGVYGLTVTAHRSGQGKRRHTLAQQTFEVRSPNSPLGLGPKTLSYQSYSPYWTLSATSTTDIPDESTVTISGALIRPESDLPTSTAEPPHSLASTPEADYEDLMGPGQNVHRTLDGMSDCFRGAHHYILPAVHSIAGFYGSATGVCKRCGLKKKHPPFSWKNLSTRKSTRSQEKQSNEASTPQSDMLIMNAPDMKLPDYDGLLEACFTAGGGTWSQFELLARQVSNDPVFPYEAAQLLSALGHVDLELDAAGRRPNQWKVAPCVLVTTANEHIYLAGYRSPRLLEAIEKAVKERGGILKAERSKDGPTVFRIIGIGEASLAAIVESVNRNEGMRLHIASRPGGSIAVSLSPLRRILTYDREVPLPHIAARFDVGRCYWVTIGYAASDGLYRTNSMPRSYILKRGSTSYEVSYRTGKHLAGAFSGRSLLAYDPQKEQLVCPLGAQLPGLYERAVVLSSGLPPIIELAQAKVAYHQVPKDIAASVWAAIYGDAPTKN